MEDISINISEINEVVAITVEQHDDDVVLQVNEISEVVNINVNEAPERVNIDVNETIESVQIQVVEGRDGRDGADGADGYTPVKGVDYFDGEKGDKGDTGNTGAPGADGAGVDPAAVQLFELLNEVKTGYGKYTETVFTGSDITQINYWSTSAKTLKLFTKDITYTAGNPTTIVLKDEVTGKLLTTTIAYSGSDVLNITKVVS